MRWADFLFRGITGTVGPAERTGYLLKHPPRKNGRGRISVVNQIRVLRGTSVRFK